ncbi:FHA domain-containing protein [Thiomonas sp. FB-6]|uniref:FHA domain-containing protein n=1 Tax=Thiomonas sp. FB-6 TaxID=1158291 RepID=UPI000379E3DD|nr:FHA domain-containing protein [Thiomonas sp. FB-6]
MAKLVIFLDDKVLKEVALNKDRITLGRRPHNDVVIDNLAVSGEHAVLLREGDGYVVQDLGSTNGSYINGKPVKRAPFREGDSLDIGKYTLRLLSDARASAFAGSRFAPSGYTPSGFTTTGSRAGAATAAADSTARATQYQEPGGSALKLRVVNGSSAGAELALERSRTTFGQRGVMVVAIQRNPRGYELSQIEGEERVRVNGTALGVVPVVLSAGDVIEMAGGTRVQLLGA